MPTKSIRQLDDAELAALNQELMAERAKAEDEFKTRQAAIRLELDRRAIAAAAASVPPEVRAAILAEAGAAPADEG